jgi:hypothetical protein
VSKAKIAAATVFVLVHVPAEIRQLVHAQDCDHQPPAERIDMRRGPVREAGQRTVVGRLRGDHVDACERILGGSRRMQALACCRRDDQGTRCSSRKAPAMARAFPSSSDASVREYAASARS